MKKFIGYIVVTLMALFSMTSAHAALPLVVGTTLTDIQTDALALIDLVWPVVGAIVGGFLLIKIFKRGAAKV